MTLQNFTMNTSVFVLAAILICSLSKVHSSLQVGFYGFSCPFAEFIVKEEVRREFFFNKGVAAGLVRMHFHDCFVRGCDGSVLIDSTPSNTAEKDSPANNPSLRGFEVIDRAKARIERRCEKTVSCADILAFAARDSVELTRGLGYPVPAGRRDGRVSLDSEANNNLPGPSSNVDQLTRIFGDKGLTQHEMVTLSGAHTIGRSHCSSFSNRLYSFNNTTSQDPSLDPIYAEQLKQQCPEGNQNSVVPINPFSPTITDISYYEDLLANRGLFESDQTLMSDQATANEVNQNVADQRLWLRNFASAMVKMGRLEDPTRSPTEIRIDCRVIN